MDGIILVAGRDDFLRSFVLPGGRPLLLLGHGGDSRANIPGLGLYFAEGEGPRFERPLRDESAIAGLREPDLESLRYVFDAITSSDYPAVQGFILYATTIYVLLFLAVDLLYLAIDPRLRTTRGRR